MTRKKRRMVVVLACGVALGTATALTLSAFSSDMVFFVAPSEVAAKAPHDGRTFRMGGLVEQGSLLRSTTDGKPSAVFKIGDGGAAIEVTYVGILPDLFREGQGIVALGALQPDGSFRASEVLAKHDETYMPKDVADALKKSGRWNPAAGAPPAADTWNTLNPAKLTPAAITPAAITPGGDHPGGDHPGRDHPGNGHPGGDHQARGRRMSPELGHFALALAVMLAVAQAVLPIWGAHRRDPRLIAVAPALAIGQFIALATAFGCLVYSSVTDDFSVLNIAENSHSLKPLLYKITGVWGNHEGSTLLWCFILAICGAAVAAFGGNLPSSLRARVIGVLGATACGFELFCLLASNPFVRLWPPPFEGRDMNPLLQDPGLAFHPPILYVGYVGFAIPFAFAVAALLEGRVDAAWGRWVRPWTLGAWCALTGGIALGSWWSYYILGWGGFWFWDPVENASLLPWLTGTALLHSAIVVEKREALKTWTVLLAIGTFSLSLSGTFLVRSGILNSVHSFATDPTRGVFILALLGIVIGGSLLLFAFRAPVLSNTGLFAPISREGALVLNNILLCSIAAVVITGTMYPLFADLLFGQKISVGAPFFNATVFPLAVPVFAAMSVGPVLSWKRAAVGPALIRLWWAAIAALVVGVLASFQTRALPALCFGAAAWVICGALNELVERTKLFRVPLATSLARLGGIPRATYGAMLAHAGLGVTIAGIAGAALSSDTIALVKPGGTVDLAGYEFRLLDLRDGIGSNYNSRIADIQVSRGGHVIATMAPSRRMFTTQTMTTTEAAIQTNGFRDIYAVLGDERDGAAVLRLHDNTLAPWIWFGALIMAAGGLLSLLDRRLRIGAPVRAARAALAPAE